MARRKTREEFIRDSQKTHGSLYEYSEVIYKNSHKNVKIWCVTCSISFQQTPSSHIGGRGCPECALKRTLSHTRKSLEHYLPRLKDIHGDKYRYDLFSYHNYDTKSSIECQCGNIFHMSMEKLLRGQGCPDCSSSGYKSHKPCYFYVLKVGEDAIKCGITILMRDRLNKLRRHSIYPVEVLYMLHFQTSSQAKELEDIIKANFEGNFLDKADMPDGFTETYYWKDIGEIMRIAMKFLENNNGVLTVE